MIRIIQRMCWGNLSRFRVTRGEKNCWKGQLYRDHAEAEGGNPQNHHLFDGDVLLSILKPV